MIRSKIRTKEEVKTLIGVFTLISSFIISLILFRIGLILHDERFAIASALLMAYCNGFIMFNSLLLSLKYELIDKGPKYAFKKYKLLKNLRTHMVDANIFIEKLIFNVPIAVLPELNCKFEEGYLKGKIYIRNSIKFHTLLASVHLSAALDEYVVEDNYIEENAEEYMYEFISCRFERRITFNSFEKFKDYSKNLSKYELFIDRLSNIPISSALIVGQTRQGKSYMLLVSILQMLLKEIRYNLYFIDPKISSINLLGKKINSSHTASEFEDILKILNLFVDRMNTRKQQMEDLLHKKIDGDFRDFNLEPHILIFDEYAAFSIMLDDKKKKDEVTRLISQIVLKGGQLGFFIWIVMQKSDSKNLETNIRENLPFILVVGSSGPQTYVTAFGHVDIPNFKFCPGEGVYTYPGIALTPKLCSISTLNFDIAKAFDELS